MSQRIDTGFTIADRLNFGAPLTMEIDRVPHWKPVQPYKQNPPGYVPGTEQSKPGSKSLRAKKAEALHRNMRLMIEKHGIERVAFCTLTFADHVCSYREGQRRYNSLASNLLKEVFGDYLCAVHRGEQRGRLHYHLAAVCHGDIRTGFDFDAWRVLLAHVHLFGRKNETYRELCKPVYASANPELRRIWKVFRDRAKDYGFGLVETFPVRSNSEAVARYVGSYVKTGADRRQVRDKGMRTIRYSFKGEYCRIRDVVWPDGPALTWRDGEAALSLLLGVHDRAGLRELLGNRWAWHWRNPIMVLGEHVKRASRVFYSVCVTFDEFKGKERVEQVVLFCRDLMDWHEKEKGK